MYIINIFLLFQDKKEGKITQIDIFNRVKLHCLKILPYFRRVKIYLKATPLEQLNELFKNDFFVRRLKNAKKSVRLFCQLVS
jgi:hypothetical protein